jgi:hypothetical protein
MICNIFSASKNAIQILNDLLHYEHIDADDRFSLQGFADSIVNLLPPFRRDVQAGVGCAPSDAPPVQGYGLGEDAGGG